MAAPQAPRSPIVAVSDGNRVVMDRDWLKYFQELRRFISSVHFWVEKTAAYNANVGDRLLCKTDGGAFTVTLPASPTKGDNVLFHDATGNWNTANLTVNGNGKNIDGSSTYVASTDNQTFGLVYNGSEWRRTYR